MLHVKYSWMTLHFFSESLFVPSITLSSYFENVTYFYRIVEYTNEDYNETKSRYCRRVNLEVNFDGCLFSKIINIEYIIICLSLVFSYFICKFKTAPEVIFHEYCFLNSFMLVSLAVTMFWTRTKHIPHQSTLILILHYVRTITKPGFRDDIILPHTQPVELYHCGFSSNSQKVR